MAGGYFQSEAHFELDVQQQTAPQQLSLDSPCGAILSIPEPDAPAPSSETIQE